MYANVDNTEDIIDSRDVIERLKELEDLELEGELDDGDKEELRILRDFAEDGETNVADWAWGETLIRDDYFVTYAQELAEDVYGLKENWPYNHIDWDEAANELLQDYQELEFDGVTYYAR